MFIWPFLNTSTCLSAKEINHLNTFNFYKCLFQNKYQTVIIIYIYSRFKKKWQYSNTCKNPIQIVCALRKYFNNIYTINFNQYWKLSFKNANSINKWEGRLTKYKCIIHLKISMDKGKGGLTRKQRRKEIQKKLRKK